MTNPDAVATIRRMIQDRMQQPYPNQQKSAQEAMACLDTLVAERKELVERLQAIIDWCDIAVNNRGEFEKHGVKNLEGPVFDDAREAMQRYNESPTPPANPHHSTD